MEKEKGGNEADGTTELRKEDTRADISRRASTEDHGRAGRATMEKGISTEARVKGNKVLTYVWGSFSTRQQKDGDKQMTSSAGKRTRT